MQIYLVHLIPMMCRFADEDGRCRLGHVELEEAIEKETRRVQELAGDQSLRRGASLLLLLKLRLKYYPPHTALRKTHDRPCPSTRHSKDEIRQHGPCFPLQNPGEALIFTRTCMMIASAGPRAMLRFRLIDSASAWRASQSEACCCLRSCTCKYGRTRDQKPRRGKRRSRCRFPRLALRKNSETFLHFRLLGTLRSCCSRA